MTIRLEPSLIDLLDRVAARSGRTRSDLVREALQRQLGLLEFEQLRRLIMPYAEAKGYLTDEDVFRDIS